MQLLDAFLAFVLTLAALATVVTVTMEIFMRIFRMRRKNLIETMKLLDKEIKRGTLNLDENERLEFFRKVVENPAKNKPVKPEDLRAFFGTWVEQNKGGFKRLLNFFSQLYLGPKKRGSLHESVSLEYVLRCLAEIGSIRNIAVSSKEKLETEFNRIARKFEEIGSSVSAGFKQYAQFWSIAIGIVLAIVANVDGIRIFEAYRVNPDLALAVIENQEEFQKRSVAAGKKLEEASENEVFLKDIEDAASRAQREIAFLAEQGLPVGWNFYPNCPLDFTKENWNSTSPKCIERAIYLNRKIESPSGDAKGENFQGSVINRVANTARYDPSGFAAWLLVVILTGILIGLGSPFWFDVAKRLSRIRKGLQSASASAEYRLSASNANGNYEKRREIVKNVLAEAAAEAQVESAEIPRGRNLLAPDGSAYGKGGIL